MSRQGPSIKLLPQHHELFSRFREKVQTSGMKVWFVVSRMIEDYLSGKWKP